MVNPILPQMMMPQGVSNTPGAIIINTGGPATAGSIAIGGGLQGGMPMSISTAGSFQTGGGQLGALFGALEQSLNSVSQLVSSIRTIIPGFGASMGGVANPAFAGTPFANMPLGPFAMAGGIGAMGGFTQGPAFFGGGIPSFFGGGAGMGPFPGLPGTINGMPVPGAAGAPLAFPGMFNPFGTSAMGFPGAIGGVPGMFGQQPIGFGQQPGVPGVPGAGQPGVPPQLPRLSQDDLVDFLLAGSQGGTRGTDELIEGRFARPGSRFGTAGNNEFQAATAQAYASQFKAFANGIDAVFTPGKNIGQLAANIERAQSLPMTPEAETLANVAALYRGNLPGIQLGTNRSSTYNNPVLRNLLISWGRQDLASQPGVGQTDVESIGSVVKALNEQPNPQIRQQWLNQIFDFQNNSPTSPSGAVPNVREYQVAIDLYRNGGFAQLLNNYQRGVRTQGPIQTGGGIPGQIPGQQIPGGIPGQVPGVGVPGGERLPGGPPMRPAGQSPDVDFRQLNPEQRTQLSSLNDRERAILHLWGRQMIAKGGQDGGILLTTVNDAQRTQTSGSVITRPAEVQLAQELIQRDMQEFGGVTGKNLDREFFRIMAEKFGEPGLAERYGNSPVFFAANDPNGAEARLPEEFPVDSPEWEAAMSRRSRLSSFDNAVLRLWGHDTLDGGLVDGSILAFTLMSNNSLDRGMNKSSVDALLRADAADGVVDGSSLRHSFKDVMDRVYLNGQGASAQKTFQDAETRGRALGLSLEQMGRNMQLGASQAMDIARDFVQNHPVMAGIGAGGLMAATAVCPFMAGLGAAGAGIAMGQRMMNGGTPQRA